MQHAAGVVQIVNCDSPDEAKRLVEESEGFVGRITPEMLATAQNLKWVQANTASLEHYLFPELIAHPSVLTNCRGLFGDVIAEHMFGLLLSMSRNLHRYRDQQLARVYAPITDGQDANTTEFAGGPADISSADRVHVRLQDWSLLIVGVGGIGAAIASRAVAWGIPVAGVDPKRRQLAGILPTVEPPRRLTEVIGRFDVVVIAAPHTPATEKLFNRELISRMKPGSRLINVGRGAIVETDAVVEALNNGHLAGVALDVLDVEPLPPDHPLWSNENAILTPHVAACSTVIAERHLRLICDNISRFVGGQTLRNQVDKNEWF